MAENLRPNDEPRRAEPFIDRPQTAVSDTDITKQGAQPHERTENDRAMTALRNQVTYDNERRYIDVPATEDNDKEPVVLPIEKTESSDDNGDK